VTLVPKSGSAIVFTNVAIEFQVERTRDLGSDKCSVTIRNLAQQTTARYGQKGDRLILEAGYRDALVGLFAGDITRIGATSKQNDEQPQDGTLQLECGDGNVPLQQTMTKTFDANASLSDVLKFAAKQMDIDIDEIKADLKQNIGKGMSFVGLAKNAIKQVSDMIIADVTIQDNKLKIVSKTTFAGQAVLLTPETGMIGSPNATEKTVTVTSLLNAGIRPLGGVVLDSKNVSGTFKVLKVTHQGGNFIPDFKTVAELEPVG